MINNALKVSLNLKFKFLYQSSHYNEMHYNKYFNLYLLHKNNKEFYITHDKQKYIFKGCN